MQHTFRNATLPVALGAICLAALMIVLPLQAQTLDRSAPTACGDLFFSEYVEGSSFNKAMEIYNGTGAAVDLSAYTLERYSNGSPTVSDSHTLAGTVADGDVFVIANASADAAILAASDMTDGVIGYNGDDAMVLRKGAAVIDVVGQVGFDPGSEWGTGNVSTRDNTIRRQVTVGAGDTNETDAYDPAGEWDGFANNTFDGLGSHVSSGCGGTVGESLPYMDGFDNCAGGVPDGWTIVSVDADTANTWNCSTFSNVDVNGFGDTAAANEWLISPAINMNSTISEVLSFGSYTRFSDVVYPPMVVKYSTDYSGSGDPTAATWTPLTGYTLSPENSQAWTESGDVDVSGINGAAVYYSFHYTSTGTTGGTAANWRVDSFSIVVDDGSGGGDPTATTIPAVQGDGAASPVANQIVTVSGVVTVDYQDAGLDGFYIQDPVGDGNPATSDGIFVYETDATVTVDVAVGDVVSVTGTAKEFFDLTEIGEVSSIVISGTGTISPTKITLPLTSVDEFEQYEGMLVEFDQTLYVSEIFRLGRYGEVLLSPNDRIYQYTHTNAPDAAGYTQHQADVARSSIKLDDAATGQNPEPVIYPAPGLSAANTLRGGDSTDNLIGVIHYGFGEYLVEPADLNNLPVFNQTNPRPGPLTTPTDEIAVASFNALNFFTTLGSRGADTTDELTRQRDKLVDALLDIDSDIIGLMEIENNAGDTALASLVAGMNARRGGGYAYIATGLIGTDQIKVGLIYDMATVAPSGDYAVISMADYPDFNTNKNRPTLAQTFSVNATGEKFTVAVNHLKSKGSNCADTGIPGDDSPETGAGNCDGTRTAAAIAMAQWLATDPTNSGDNDIMILGDLNAYRMEDPISSLKTAGYTDLADMFASRSGLPYSFVFDGQWGYLDYAMANASMLTQVSSVVEYHINADEPIILDYNMEFKSVAQQALFYANDSYRSSDHDPIVVRLTPGVATAVSLASNSAPTATPFTLVVVLLLTLACTSVYVLRKRA